MHEGHTSLNINTYIYTQVPEDTREGSESQRLRLNDKEKKVKQRKKYKLKWMKKKTWKNKDIGEIKKG